MFMVIGTVRSVDTVCKSIMPGTEIFILNSQRPQIAVLVTDNAIITNTAEVLFPYRLIRTVWDWKRSFPIDWQAFLDSETFKLDVTPFSQEKFEPGVVVVVLSEDCKTASVEVLSGKDNKKRAWMTIEDSSIPYSKNDKIVPTGVIYDPLE